MFIWKVWIIITLSKLNIKHKSRLTSIFRLIQNTKMWSSIFLCILLPSLFSHFVLTSFADFLSTLIINIGNFQDSVLGLHFCFSYTPSQMSFLHSLDLNYHMFNTTFKFLSLGQASLSFSIGHPMTLLTSLLKSFTGNLS